MTWIFSNRILRRECTIETLVRLDCGLNCHVIVVQDRDFVQSDVESQTLFSAGDFFGRSQKSKGNSV